MINSDLLAAYSEAARAWDNWYARSLKIHENAVRVEQGEYGVVGIGRALGTFNVRQCVVLYLATERVHGLAHIDGHTEIRSLVQYLDALGVEREQTPQCIKIIGAKSKDIMGLNDSEANIRKVALFLQEFFKQGINVDSLIKERLESLNFVIEYPGEVRHNYFAPGTYNKEQALHTIQEIRRKDSFLGTYPIARANDGHSKCVFLDERAITKLNEYLKNIDKDKPRNSLDLDNYGAFDSAVPIILEEWKRNAKALQLPHPCTTLVFIGDGADSLNLKMLPEVQKYINSANIDFVLQYCAGVDSGLDIEQVKSHLVGQDGEKIDSKVFGFDAGITAKMLLCTISMCSKKLSKLMLLNSQGGCDLDGRRYTIEEAKGATEGEKLALLQQVIAEYNAQISDSRGDLSPQTIDLLITSQCQPRVPNLTRADKIRLASRDKVLHTRIDDFCKKYELDSNQVHSSFERRCSKAKESKIRQDQITDKSNFAFVQNDFLKRLAGSLDDFNSLSIGMNLSEFADGSFHVCDLDVGEKFFHVIGEHLEH